MAGLTQIEALIEVAQSDCADMWSLYCNLAHGLTQPNASENTPEQAARKLLAENSKCRHHVRWNNKVPPTELERTAEEARSVEGEFRKRLLLALQTGRYSLEAFRGLEKITVPPELIKAGDFRFESDEIKVNSETLVGVRLVSDSANAEMHTDRPGRKPGQQTVKETACGIAISILDKDSQRPPKRRGRLTELARMVCTDLNKRGKNYTPGTIEKYIRPTAKEWERKNPGK